MAKTYFHLFSIFYFIVFSLGCASTESVLKQYDLVDYSDGIDALEAKSITQQEFLSIPYTRGAYNVYKPYVVSHPEISQYPNLWFIALPAQEKKNTQSFLCVIDRRTGAVIRALDWRVDNNPGISWVFNQNN